MSNRPHEQRIRRDAALIYAVTVIACLGALAALADIAILIQAPTIAGEILIVWGIALAGPGILLAGALFSPGYVSSVASYWTTVVLCVPVTLLPVYFIARAGSKRARLIAVACQGLMLALGWVAYFLIYAAEVRSP